MSIRECELKIWSKVNNYSCHALEIIIYNLYKKKNTHSQLIF